MVVLKGEPLAVGIPWPPSLLAALQRWGTTQPKAPCLTALDTAGKAVYTLTYGKCHQKAFGLWSSCNMLPVMSYNTAVQLHEHDGADPEKPTQLPTNQNIASVHVPPTPTRCPFLQQRGLLTHCW